MESKENACQRQVICGLGCHVGQSGATGGAPATIVRALAAGPAREGTPTLKCATVDSELELELEAPSDSDTEVDPRSSHRVTGMARRYRDCSTSVSDYRDLRVSLRVTAAAAAPLRNCSWARGLRFQRSTGMPPGPAGPVPGRRRDFKLDSDRANVTGKRPPGADLMMIRLRVGQRLSYGSG
jgi:hypothetical protein